MAEQSTALARTEELLTEDDRDELRQIRRAGAVAIHRQKAINETRDQLAGLRWGDVSGDKLSVQTRTAIAKLCELTGADPVLHLYILGGRPYLNADYWAQTVAQNPHNLGFEQISITKDTAESYRTQARQLVKDAEAMQMPELRDDALLLMRKAAYADQARAQYGVDDKTVAAYETVLRRYSENAPLRAIRDGQVDGSPFVIEIRECNLAGGGRKGDPVGDSRPHETARTRSLRRAAIRAFATTLQPFEEELRQLEDAIEAEFEDITHQAATDRATLPKAGERPAARIGAGEPTAASAEGAIPLPVQEIGTRKPELSAEAQAERQKYIEGCRHLDINPASSMLLSKLGGRTPESIDDFQTLNRALSALADGGEAPV